MKPNKDKKDNTFLYIISTITFVLLGIILTSVINQTKSKDTRIRASATTGISATAVVTAIDSGTNTITINQLTFASNKDKTLGTWVITPPSSFVVSSIIPGNTITIKIDPARFDIQNHTLTAKEIKKK
jgi:anti-sigma-K factor RskA